MFFFVSLLIPGTGPQTRGMISNMAEHDGSSKHSWRAKMQLNIAIAGFPCVPVFHWFIKFTRKNQINKIRKKKFYRIFVVYFSFYSKQMIFTCSQISGRRWYILCWCYWCWLHRFWVWWWWINCVTALAFGKFTAIYPINVLNHEQIAKCIQCQFIETNSHDYDVKRLCETARLIYIFRFECLFLRFNH